MENRQKIHSFSVAGEASFVIPVAPVTKKNSQIIIRKGNGRPAVIPSKAYRQYEKEASLFVPKLHVNEPVNVKAIFFMKTARRVDLTNLNEALHDMLVHAGCLEDDNCRIIVSTDGSRVRCDRENPRTEVTITRITEESAMS